MLLSAKFLSIGYIVRIITRTNKVIKAILEASVHSEARQIVVIYYTFGLLFAMQKYNGYIMFVQVPVYKKKKAFVVSLIFIIVFIRSTQESAPPETSGWRKVPSPSHLIIFQDGHLLLIVGSTRRLRLTVSDYNDYKMVARIIFISAYYQKPVLYFIQLNSTLFF